MNEAVATARVATPRRRSAEARVDQQPAFVLHTYPWRETSLVIEMLTRDFGRVALVARGAKRPTSHFRGLLSPFAPLVIAWSGRNEIKSLIRVEWCGGLAPLRGDGLLAAFYLNELLVRLLARGDPHETLFSSYLEALRGLAQSEASNEREAERAREVALRNFELDLLRDVGWLPTLDHAIDGSAIDEQAHYRVDAERGLLPVTRSAYGNGGAGDAITICGRTALALARRDLHNIANDAAAESKGLLRFLIRYHLGGRPLNTRRILQDLKRL